VVQLIVNDGTISSLPACGRSSTGLTTVGGRTSTVTITNSAIAPIANPGLPQTVAVGGFASLDGANSSDPDGHVLSYRWTLLSAPSGSAASLSFSTSPYPYFMADVAGKYAVQLIVNDGFMDSTPATVLISSDNSRPVADPGLHRTVAVGSTVQLSGTESTDADGNPLTYRWAILYQPSAANAILSSATTVDPTFIASKAGLYVVQLIANDGQLNSAPVTTWINAAVNQAPVVSAGSNQSITLPATRVTQYGSATDDGLPNNTLTVSWTLVSGPASVIFSSPNTAITDVLFSVPGTYVLQIAANDSQLNSTATATVTVNPAPPTVVLAPAMAGPDVTGTSQTLTATVTQAGVPVVGTAVQFTVTGVNATSGNANTNSSGVATFSYIGTHQGADTVRATSGGSTSNIANISWITPVQIISTSTVLGRFFPGNSNQCSFNTAPTASPVFTQEFPTIDFNPPAGTIRGNTSGVGVNTRPFTDVTTDMNGNFTGVIVAQGNSRQAGVAPLDAFQTVFTGSFTVASAGHATITLFDDDGIILGIGGGSTLVSSSKPPSGTNPGPTTPFTSLPVIYYYNQITQGGPQGFTLVVNFPTPGTYPFELDYVECAEGQLSMTMTAGTSGAPPTGSLAITPINPAQINTGQVETLAVQASDGSGAPVPNLGVSFIIDGANQQFLSGTTNASGQATVQYTGANAGTDSVQVVADISGMMSFSNVVSVPWTLPGGGGGGGSTFVPQGWIGSPLIGAVVQGQVPITVASGITLASGVLEYWPTSNPSAVTILNANTTGTGTIGTFDGTTLASGGYTIQLNATSSTGATQISVIAVDVTGENKPGRERVTLTDFKVPLAGIPVSISRTYDSLARNVVGDFGYGWSQAVGVNLTVDAFNNVTFNFNNQRVTFNFVPQAQNGLFPWLLVPIYAPAPGYHGTLTSDGCNALVQVQSDVACFPSGSKYQPATYFYTDPSGRMYTIAATGQLQSIKDLNGNTLTFAPNGITSSIGGVVVPFIRDGQGRITQITDLNQNNYVYTYDTCGTGNLCSVTYPGISTPAVYTYTPDHSLKTRVDPNNNTWTYTYYTDPANNGRLQTVTSPSVAGAPNGYLTQYSYNVATNKTTTTNPDTGVITETDDNFGKPLTIIDPLNNTTTFTYNPHETLHTKVDPLNQAQNLATVYTYDANDFLQTLTDPLNHQTTWINNQFGEVTSTTDAAQQNTTTIGYDTFFNPYTSSDSFGPLYARTYDSVGNILTQTDANGNATQFTYDSKGNLVKIVDPLNGVTTFTYDPMDRIVSRTDPRQNQTLYAYDALGNLTDTTDAVGHVWRSTYDLNGNKTSDVDPMGRTTSYVYDALNRLAAVTYPDQTTKQYTYDFRNKKLTETDQSGRVTQYQYFLDGHLKSVTYALGTGDVGTVQYTYDADGNRKTVTDELNNKTTYNYDAANRLTSVQDALNGLTQYGYDADNRRTSMIDANNNPATTYAYDARSRLKTITHPDQTTDQYTWDGVGNQKTATDQAGKLTQRNYDALNRLASVTDPLTKVTQYAYDPAGNLLSITDANNHVTSFQYDSLNHQIMRGLPIGMVETSAYDAVGNLSAKTDFNGKTTIYSYDQLNRLLKKVPDPSLSQPSIVFTYFPTGTRQTMTDASGVTNYTYDNRDRLKSKATPEGTLNYTHDAHGNLLTILSSNANGASVTYTPDALNRVGTVVDNRLVAQGVTSATTSYTYYPVGTVKNYTYSANGMQTAYTYDMQNRLVSIGSTKGSSGLSSFTYSPFPALTQTVSELSGRGVSYGYDNDYHLQSETITADPAGNNGVENYTYDSVGNRKTLTSTIPSLPGSISYSYDANDRLSTDTYDNNGNTIASAGVTNTYDFENRMLTHGAVSMVYDGDGNRVSEMSGGVATQYLVDTLNPTGYSQVLDELVSGAVTKTYTYGLQRISENQLSGSTWTPTFYGYDGHGHVRFLTSTTGAVGNTYQYDAFGMPVASAGTTLNTYLFSGERFDSNLNLYHLRARYYNQATGRFETMDPISTPTCCGSFASQSENVFYPGSLHAYFYSQGNPVNRIDPQGTADIEEEGFSYLKSLEYRKIVKSIIRYNDWPKIQGFCIGVADKAASATGEPDLWLLVYSACLANFAAPFN
jgi:RHS repeat-associated protein